MDIHRRPRACSAAGGQSHCATRSSETTNDVGVDRHQLSTLVITQPDEYRARLNAVVAAADVIKVSDEDLKYLYPELDSMTAARRLLEGGPKAVVVTAGSSPVEILTRRVQPSGCTQVDIVDTVGAGDTFCAGFVAWWVQRSTHSDVHRTRWATSTSLQPRQVFTHPSQSVAAGPTLPIERTQR